MLPPEIMSLVCGFLCGEALKEVRQVSKKWERAAVPYLFDKVFISQDLADFRIAKLVIRHFKHYVRTLVFSSNYYEKLNRERFGRKFKQFHNDFRTDDDIGHSDLDFTLYRTARKKHQKAVTDASCFKYLTFALRSLPNLRKTILTDKPSSRAMPQQSLQIYHSRRLKACPFVHCGATAADHIPRAVRQSGFSRNGSSNPWRIMLSALSTTNADIRELTMEPYDLDVSTDTAAFSMSPCYLPQAAISFQNLTKLRLSLLVDTERFSTNVEKHHFHRNAEKLLRSAINLEYLSIDLSDEVPICEPGCSTLGDVLGQCRFPKLRLLILGFFVSSQEELLRLLKYSKALEQLTIKCHSLVEGSWTQVANWIRASLPLLKYAELNQLYGGFCEPFENHEHFDVFGDVEKFLFAQGENPFTTEALEKARADWKTDRQRVDSLGTLGYQKAYTKYY